MASGVPPFLESLEMKNGGELRRLIICGGTVALRRFFNGYHPPACLAAGLNANYQILKKLLKRGVLHKHQWDILFPPGGATPNPNSFDINLLFLLLTNICGLYPPPTGWNKKPPSTDTSHEANLARVKFNRNVCCVNPRTFDVDAPTFSAMWKEISGALVDLGLHQAEVTLISPTSFVSRYLKEFEHFTETLILYHQSLISRYLKEFEHFTETLIPPKSFVSRYLKEFEHELFLGGGGFGQVFQAKNKLDGCHYAIKRIRLPNCDEALEKVKREVKALAKLEHPGIVRYYYSWLEEPPVGWQEECDAQMFEQGTSSEVSSTPTDELHGQSGVTNGCHSNAIESESSSGSIVFRHSDDSSQTQDAIDIESLPLSENPEDSRSKDTSSLLSSNKHKCQNKNCSADRSPPQYLYIQMQLCQRETLKERLQKDTCERDHVFGLKVFEQILDAVEYFHHKGFVHRDLTPSNIFFSLAGSVKVGDFGLSKAYTSENIMDTPVEGASLLYDMSYTAKHGALLYMSPELMEGKGYSHKVDIFSLGVIFFELFYPFGTEMERIKVLEGVREGTIPSDFKEKMPLQSELVRWLLSATPEARPDAKDVKKSDLLKQIRQSFDDQS